MTSIIPLDKKRSRVYIDSEFAFVLYKGELFKYRLCENQEIPEEIYKEITEILLVKRAKLRAMNLLTKRDYSEKALRDKLVQGEYPSEIAEKAIAYVKSFGYIDDQRYAESFLRTYQGRKTLGKMKTELAGKGISKDIIDRVVVEFEEKEEEHTREEIELEMAVQLLMKKHYDSSIADAKEKQRMFGFLMRKGFSTDIVYKALNCTEDDEYM